MAEKEYIDRERLFNALNAYNTKFNAEINSIILSIPKENVQEVRHAKWVKRDIFGEDPVECDCCGNTVSVYGYDYCPHCGAKME